jgi:hypothetical protein
MRYHPVIGLPDHVRVRIMREPYELGDGTLICKAKCIGCQQIVYPCVDALTEALDE